MRVLCFVFSLEDGIWLKNYLDQNSDSNEIVLVTPTIDGIIIAESFGLPYITCEEKAWSLDKAEILHEAYTKTRYWHELPELKSNFTLQSIANFIDYPLFIMHQSLLLLGVSEIIQSHKFIHKIIESEKPDSILFGARNNPFLGQPIDFITGSNGVEREILKSIANRYCQPGFISTYIDSSTEHYPAPTQRPVNSSILSWPAQFTGPKILIYAWSDFYLEYFERVLRLLLNHKARICIVIIGGALTDEQSLAWNKIGICNFKKSDWIIHNQENIYKMWRLKCIDAAKSIYDSKVLENYFSDEYGSYFPGLVSDFLVKQIVDSAETVVGLLQSEAIIKAFEPDMVLNHFSLHPSETCDVLPARKLGIPTLSFDHGVGAYTTSYRETFATQYYAASGKCSREGLLLATQTSPDSVIAIGNTRYDDLKVFSGSSAEIKAQFGFDPERPLCIFTDSSGWSHMNEWRHSTASTLATIISLKDHFPQLQIIYRVHHGSDYKGIKSYIERLENTDIRFQLSPHPPLMEILPAADLLISHYSSSIAEALLFGVPVIYLTTHTEPEPSCFNCETIKIADSPVKLRGLVTELLQAAYPREIVRQLAQPYFDMALAGNDNMASERLAELILKLASKPREERYYGFDDWISRVNACSQFSLKEYRQMQLYNEGKLSSDPFISVIIPTYNRGKMLSITLNSLLNQNYPSYRYEIIIADNNSTDSTKATVEAWQKQTTIPIKYLFEARKGAHNARNSAAKQARGEIFYFTDDDMIADGNLLRQIALMFSLNSKIGTATGRVLPKWEADPPEWVVGLCMNGYLSLSDYGDGVKIEAEDMGVWSCHQAIKREVFFQSGGYNPDIINGIAIGDNEVGLNKKIRKLGYLFGYNGNMITHHIIPKGRMTQFYLNKRLEQQGGCDSYGDYKEHLYTNDELISIIRKSYQCLSERASNALVKRCNQDVTWRLDKAYVYYWLNRINYDYMLLTSEVWREMVLNDDWLSCGSKYDEIIEEYARMSMDTHFSEDPLYGSGLVNVNLADFDYSSPYRMDNFKQFQLDYGFSIIPVSYFEPVPDLRSIDIHGDHSNKIIMNLEFKYDDTFIQDSVVAIVKLVPEQIVCNPMIPCKDLLVYGQFITHCNPAKIIEIGSGYSACFARTYCELSGKKSEIIAIEPEPNDLLKEFSSKSMVHILKKKIQDIDDDEMSLVKLLQANDILFIDASHVSLRGSDTNYIFINILPSLASGVVIHIHDIYLPYDYINGYYELGRFYNEQYLLASILANSNRYKCLYSTYDNYINNGGDYGASFWISVK